MLFGRTHEFAIEAMSEPDLPRPSAVWGRMRIWCQGHPIGNYSDRHCALYPAYSAFQELARNLGTLWMQEFEGLSDAQLWNRLDEILYGYHGDVEVHDDRTVEECREDWNTYGRFNFLTNWGEQFDDNGKSFIFRTDGDTVKVLNWHFLQERALALNVPATSVQQAIRDFSAWFDAEVERLRNEA